MKKSLHRFGLVLGLFVLAGGEVWAQCVRQYSGTGTGTTTAGGAAGLYGQYYANAFYTQAGFNEANPLAFFLGSASGAQRVDPMLNYTDAGFNTPGSISPPATGGAGIPTAFSARYRGNVSLKAGAAYTFYLTSDDASYMFLGNEATLASPTPANAFIKNGGAHGSAVQAATFTAPTTRLYDLQILLGQDGGNVVLKLEYAGGPDNLARQVVPQAALCAGPSGLVYTAPTANDGLNSPAAVNTGGQIALTPGLSATAGGTGQSIRYYTVFPASAGTLYNNGVAVTGPSIVLAGNTGQLKYQPAAGATTPATFTYTATDTNPYDSNTATYTIPVIAASADVATTLALAPTSASVQAGTSLTFTITSTNNGPTIATGVAPKVQLPAGLLLTAANLPSGATYTNATGLVTLPTTAVMANGATLTYAITFNAPNYTTALAGTASSGATSADPSATNNDGSQANAKVSTTVTLPANGCAGTPYGPSASSGLYGEFYTGYFANNPSYFAGKTPGLIRTDGTVNFPNTNSFGNILPPATGTVDDPDAFSVRYRGSISIATAGDYTFYLSSDDQSYLWLDGAALATTPTTASAVTGAGYNASGQKTVTLSAGVHNVLILYGENGGGNNLMLQYSGPGITGTVVVPNSVLCASMSQVPVANAVTNSPAILSNSGQTPIQALGGRDPDGQVDFYTIQTLPASTAGTLYYYNGTTTTAVTVNQSIPAANAGNLRFSPVASYSGPASFTYAALDNSGELSPPATYNLTVALATADVTTTLGGPQQLGAGQPAGPYTAVFTNNGPDQATQVTQVITLPLGATMTPAQVTNSGGTYTAGNATTAGTLRFGTAPVALASGASNTYTFTITAPTAVGTNYSITSTVGAGTNQGGNSAPDANTLAITVTAANRFVTYSDNNSLAKNTSVRASVILNDDNPDATTSFTATVVTNPTHGAVTLSADGGYVYTPNPNYVGTDAFTYQICQTGTTPTCSNTSIVKLNIYDSNLVCTSGTGSNLLLNPSFTDGNVNFNSSYGYVAQAANALVPEGKYGVGNDASQYHNQFTGTGRTGTGDNFMIVNGAANIQKVYSQTVSVLPNRYYTFSVYATSVNPGSPAQLGFVINNESTSVVTTLNGTTNYVKLSDVWFSGESTTATFEIRDVNRAPGGNDFGLDDVYFGTCTKNLLVDSKTNPALPKNADATAILPLTGTASGGPTLVSFTIQTLPVAASGTLALNGVAVKAGDVIQLSDAGKLTFDPNPAATYSGSQAVFTYTATDSNGAGSDNTATFTIPLDTPVTAVDDVVSTPLNIAITINVTGNDRLGANGSPINQASVDLDPKTAGLQQGQPVPIAVTGGSFSVSNTGIVTFTPTTGFLGTAFIPYTVTDSSTPLPSIMSNQATILVRVVSQLDLSTVISLPATGGAVTAGQSITISGTTKNNSPVGTAADVVQKVQLPANLTGTPTFTRGGASVAATYDKTTGLVVFPTLLAGSFGAGSTSDFGVTFIAPATGPLTATASVNNSSPDVNLVNNVSSITLSVTPQSNLVTTLTGPASVPTGNLATYTVTTANNGPSPASGVVQTVTLAASLSGVFATNGGVYDKTTGVVTFPPQDLTTGQTQTNSVSFSPTANFTPSAAITGAGSSANLNGAATAAAVAVSSPASTAKSNLYVTVQSTGAAATGQVAPGSLAAYTVTQGNYGPDAAAIGVQTQVSLPAQLAAADLTVGGQSGTADGSGAINFASGAKYTIGTGLLVLPALTTIQASAATPQSYTISLRAPVVGLALTVTASVSAPTTDPVPANNVATVQTEIQPLADLAISLSRIEGGTTAVGGTATLTAGQAVAYSVQTVNNSPGAAQNVLQTVAIPGGIPVASLQLNGLIGTLSNGIITFGNGATYSQASGLLSLPPQMLAGGAVQTNTLSFFVPDGSVPLQAVANVSSSTTDNTPANNSASVTNSVTALQDLAVALSGPAQAVQGSPVFYTVTTTNNGTSATGQQTTTVQLPVGLGASGFLVNNTAGTANAGNTSITFGTNGTYTIASGLLALPATTVTRPGSSTTATVQFLAPVTPQIDIAAVAVSGANESNLTNNSSVLSTLTVSSALGNADLSTTITPTGGTLAVGAAVTYTVTTTNSGATGNNAAQNMAQIVALPAGLDPKTLSVNNTLGSYDRTLGVVTFNSVAGNITYNTATGALVFPAVASLAVGGTSVNKVSFPAPANGPVVATATSSSDNPDGTPSNNTAVSSTAITPQAALAFGMSGPASAAAGTTVSYTLTATNNGPTAAANTGMSVTLPASVTSYFLNSVAMSNTTPGVAVTIYGGTGNSVAAGQSVTSVISFAAPSGGVTVSGAASTTTAGTTTSNPGSITTAPANATPIANDVVNTKQTPAGNTATQLTISPPIATDAGGSVAKYTFVSVPPTSQGVLMLYGTPVGATQTITNLVDINSLTFTPAASFVGNAFFMYTVTDNAGAVSLPARYAIPVAKDIDSKYTVITKGGNANKYQKDDVIAYVIDANAAVFNGATPSGLVYNTDGTPAAGTVSNGLLGAVLTTGTLPPGTALDAATGLITVTDPTLLPRAGASYPLTITTTDSNGGTNRATFTLALGANPLPVELTAFTAVAAGRDARLAWATASEQDNDRFEVERSFDGVTFIRIATVAGQGSKAGPAAYALTDAGAAAKAQGPVYYRLRQVDAGGAATYSPVRAVSFAKSLAPAMALFPNPAVAGTQLDLRALPPGSYDAGIIDATGRVVAAVRLAGGRVHALDLAPLASGSYLVRVSGTAADGTAVNLAQRLVKE